jgi:hypothetical protein
MSRTMAVLGLSAWILASSKMTWRSRSTSFGSKVERKAMSARVWTAVSSASAGTTM